ncbi:hypothetical protein D1007_60280 [Hordeum vulgare]|nr:hypothetical protein D1007_60280 [Hordeum vulgare]
MTTTSGLTITREDKERALLDHFQANIDTPALRTKSIFSETIGMQCHDLSALDAPFDEAEIKEAVFSLPSVKAPGPDGFIGAFFKSCSKIIKADVVAMMMQLTNLRGDCASLINSANTILLPKKAGASSIGDYRPISLIHNISKIFSKLLANRLAPLLPSLVSKCQSAFVQRQCIHDNFLHGDLLSPMIFILAIDPLQLVLRGASQAGILKPIMARSASCRVSLYADDGGIFANPVKEEIDAIAHILACFGEASSLITNVSKTEVFPVRCQDIALPAILSAFPAKLASFPS